MTNPQFDTFRTVVTEILQQNTKPTIKATELASEVSKRYQAMLGVAFDVSNLGFATFEEALAVLQNDGTLKISQPAESANSVPETPPEPVPTPAAPPTAAPSKPARNLTAEPANGSWPDRLPDGVWRAYIDRNTIPVYDSEQNILLSIEGDATEAEVDELLTGQTRFRRIPRPTDEDNRAWAWAFTQERGQQLFDPNAMAVVADEGGEKISFRFAGFLHHTQRSDWFAYRGRCTSGFVRQWTEANQIDARTFLSCSSRRTSKQELMKRPESQQPPVAPEDFLKLRADESPAGTMIPPTVSAAPPQPAAAPPVVAPPVAVQPVAVQPAAVQPVAAPPATVVSTASPQPVAVPAAVELAAVTSTESPPSEAVAATIESATVVSTTSPQPVAVPAAVELAAAVSTVSPPPEAVPTTIEPAVAVIPSTDMPLNSSATVTVPATSPSNDRPQAAAVRQQRVSERSIQATARADLKDHGLKAIESRSGAIRAAVLGILVSLDDETLATVYQRLIELIPDLDPNAENTQPRKPK